MPFRRRNPPPGRPRQSAPAAPRGVAMPLALTLLIITAMAFVLLIQVARVTTETYAWERSVAERQSWQARNSELAAEVAHLRSLSRIEREARERLKMVPATEFIYVTVPTSAPSHVANERPASAPRPAAETIATGPLELILRWLGGGE